jgi:signal transduction histidine kinase
VSAGGETDRSSGVLIALFGAVVASFIVVTVYAQHLLGPIDVAADSIARNAAPSIEALAAARAETRTVQFELTRLLDARANGRPLDRTSLDRALDQLDVNIERYVLLPAFSWEEPHFAELKRGARTLRIDVERVLAAPDTPALAAVDRDAGALIDHAMQLLALDAQESARLGREIEHVRRRARSTGLALDSLCVLLSLGAVLVARQGMLRSRASMRARAVDAEARAKELDMFAARVAHDMRNPLQAILLSLDLASRDRLEPAARTTAIQRARKSAQRALSMIDAILAFARARRAEDADERAELEEVVTGVISELAPFAEEHRVAIAVEPMPSCKVASSTGALASVTGNLVRNAILHMGDREERRVSVRATVGERVLVEIEDTGPGVPPQLVQTIFEPYVRGTSAPSGLGLGLATAKRLVEAHGGSIGVRARAGGGSVFWFELPRAERDS